MRTTHRRLGLLPVALFFVLGVDFALARAQYNQPRPPMPYGGYGGYGGGYGNQSMNRYGNRSGGYGNANSASPVYVISPPAEAYQGQQVASAGGLALTAAGVPNDGGRLRWPAVLRLMGPDAERLRGQAEAACQAAALKAQQGASDTADGRSLGEAVDGLRAHVNRIRDRVTLPREAYAEAEWFLDVLKAAPEALARTASYDSPKLRSEEKGEYPAAREVEVAMVDTAFEPRVVVVPAGSAVRWTNRGGHRHTATSDAGDWDSGEMGPGKSFSQVFTKPGSYPYHCEAHPGQMRGVILVK